VHKITEGGGYRTLASGRELGVRQENVFGGKRKGMGRIRKLFPGSNSAYGFYSLYDQIVGPEAERIIILKGGPGTGKSSFMTKIAKALSESGYDLEYHFCSSANGSLDALYLPGRKIALMDGTSPHIIEPKYPGAVEEIVNLGEYWDAAKLREQKKTIIGLQDEISNSFRQAYHMLAAAKLYRDALEGCFRDTNQTLMLSLVGDLLQKIVPEGRTTFIRKRPRRLFASAITPDGPVNYLDTLVGHLSHVYILVGKNSGIKSRIVAKILAGITEYGYFVEIYPCAFDPRRMEHLVIPALDTAIISSAQPHSYSPSGANEVVIDDEVLHPALRRGFDQAGAGGDLGALQEGLHKTFQQAVSFLSRAKLLHDELEGLYIPLMKFAQIDSLRERLLLSILDN
jgi:hypothetical protein